MSHLYEREQTEAIRTIRKAAQLCRSVGAQIRPATLDKKDKSPVTVADFGSQALICRALAEVFPDRSDHCRGRLGRAAAGGEHVDSQPGRRPCAGDRVWR